jgi:hypothetical protein
MKIVSARVVTGFIAKDIYYFSTSLSIIEYIFYANTEFFFIAFRIFYLVNRSRQRILLSTPCVLTMGLFPKRRPPCSYSPYAFSNEYDFFKESASFARKSYSFIFNAENPYLRCLPPYQRYCVETSDTFVKSPVEYPSPRILPKLISYPKTLIRFLQFVPFRFGPVGYNPGISIP